MTVTDFTEHFTRAKKPETLERMVCRLVADMHLRFNPAKESYRTAADCYQRLGNKRAADMLSAAWTREQEIEGKTAKPAQKSSQKKPSQIPEARPAQQPGLEREMAAWFASERKSATA